MTTKQKRIKKVFPSDQVLHLWANQSQSDARSSNVFFEGKSCYSYGRHYELGRLVSYKGKTVALINDSGYSVTTGKHISHAFGAVMHLPNLGCKGDFSPASIPQLLLVRQEELIDQLMSHFSKRQFYDLKHSRWNSKNDYGIKNLIQKFNSICKELGHKEFSIEITAEFIDLYNDAVRIGVLRREKSKTPEALKEKAEQAAKRSAKDLESWRQGGNLPQSLRYTALQFIRVIGDEVQTSKGARVPLNHALRLLNKIKAGKVKDGERVGSFQFNNIKEGLIKIGCHTISLSEAEAVLGQLKPALALVSNEGA